MDQAVGQQVRRGGQIVLALARLDLLQQRPRLVVVALPVGQPGETEPGLLHMRIFRIFRQNQPEKAGSLSVRLSGQGRVLRPAKQHFGRQHAVRIRRLEVFGQFHRRLRVARQGSRRQFTLQRQLVALRVDGFGAKLRVQVRRRRELAEPFVKLRLFQQHVFAALLRESGRVAVEGRLQRLRGFVQRLQGRPLGLAPGVGVDGIGGFRLRPPEPSQRLRRRQRVGVLHGSERLDGPRVLLRLHLTASLVESRIRRGVGRGRPRHVREEVVRLVESPIFVEEDGGGEGGRLHVLRRRALLGTGLLALRILFDHGLVLRQRLGALVIAFVQPGQEAAAAGPKEVSEKGASASSERPAAMSSPSWKQAVPW